MTATTHGETGVAGAAGIGPLDTTAGAGLISALPIPSVHLGILLSIHRGTAATITISTTTTTVHRLTMVGATIVMCTVLPRGAVVTPTTQSATTTAITHTMVLAGRAPAVPEPITLDILAATMTRKPPVVYVMVFLHGHDRPLRSRKMAMVSRPHKGSRIAPEPA